MDRLLELFVEEGFSTLTTEEMCRRLRCSKSTLYLVAGSREQIVIAIVRHFYARMSARIREAVEAEPDRARRLARYLVAVGEAVDGTSIAFFVDLVSYAPVASAHAEGQRDAAAYVEELVHDAVGSGAIRIVDATLVAQVLANLIAGVQVGDIGKGARRTPVEVLADLGDLLLAGLAPDTPERSAGQSADAAR